MDKSITTRKTKARYIFTLFKVLDVEYNSQPKMRCKFCEWTVTKNATRMTNHIIDSCKSCPTTVRKHAYLIQTSKDNKHTNFVKIDNHKSNENQTITLANSNDTTGDSQNADEESTYIIRNSIEPENVEFDDQLIDNKSNVQDYKPQSIKIIEKTTSDSTPKYKWAVLDAVTDGNSEDKDDNIEVIENPSNELKDKDFKKESKAFGNLITSEIDSIDDLEIVNQIKSEMTNILFNLKRQYFKQLKLNNKSINNSF